MASKNKPADTNVIVDNMRRCVKDFLQENIKVNSDLSVVSAYFTIYAYKDLQNTLESLAYTRFLYGDPQNVGKMDPVEDEGKYFCLDDQGKLVQNQDASLTQNRLAQACAKWITNKVDIRTIDRANFLHGKMYHIATQDNTSATLVGSSNFTRRGLGSSAKHNIELNVEIFKHDEQTMLAQWFDNLWNDHDLTRDVKQEVLDALERLGKRYSPQFVYYKTLLNIFESRLSEYSDSDKFFDDIQLPNTVIWQQLYEFQKHGAKIAINRLKKYNGCIIADSVGLGKTWTALAIIKYFELQNQSVLVLCPKKLQENWTRFLSSAKWKNNPFEKDRLNYTVLAHTDLGYYEGKRGNIDLAQFNWGGFELIVIDESHNFRNEGSDRIDESGNIIRRSRYNRLLEDAIKDGIPTKVLMLSATPVNTSLRDLRNQIYFMTEKNQYAFQKTLGIGNLQTVFGKAQKVFKKWEEDRKKNQNTDKTTLLENLGADFLSLLEAVSIARSRKHIDRFYPEVAKDFGGFPTRTQPENLTPATDSKGELSYDDLHKKIEKLRLAVYKPSQYLKDSSALEEEKEQSRFDQRDREKWLIGMMKTNLLKRLESSVHSFTRTVERILNKMDDTNKLIENWKKQKSSEEFESVPDADEEDEDFVIGKKRVYTFSEINIEHWQKDLIEDIGVFQTLRDLAEQVTPKRDRKLAEIKRVLKDKVETAPVDKDGHANRKSLVFTTFSDTARYLYEQLEKWARDELDIHIALITGGDGNKSTVGTHNFHEILEYFAPKAQQKEKNEKEIEILIATDCLSEGQNLQDCDLVVNYDIHWNPVRLMQRFGRIDRLGSRNKQVSMINFWPTDDLELYLDLKNRVEARMILADATATGSDDLLNEDAQTADPNDEGLVQSELKFRDEQLVRLRNEILDIEEVDDGVSISDFTLDDFIADLLQYVQVNRKKLEEAPNGIYAITNTDNPSLHGISPGAIFCLKQQEEAFEKSPNILQPYFLIYIYNGGVRYTFKQAKQSLTLFRKLAAGDPEAKHELEDAFAKETNHGENMEKYNEWICSALHSIKETLRTEELKALTTDRGARIPGKTRTQEFELLTWLIIV